MAAPSARRRSASAHLLPAVTMLRVWVSLQKSQLLNPLLLAGRCSRQAGLLSRQTRHMVKMEDQAAMHRSSSRRDKLPKAWRCQPCWRSRLLHQQCHQARPRQ